MRKNILQILNNNLDTEVALGWDFFGIPNPEAEISKIPKSAGLGFFRAKSQKIPEIFF